jgi:hypothetical protein
MPPLEWRILPAETAGLDEKTAENNSFMVNLNRSKEMQLAPSVSA